MKERGKRGEGGRSEGLSEGAREAWSWEACRARVKERGGVEREGGAKVESGGVQRVEE